MSAERVLWQNPSRDPRDPGVQRTLAEDLQAGRPEALDRLLAEHGREIQAVAFLILHDPDEASDVLAETLVTAWRKAGTLRNPDALRPWLLRVATNRALSRRRAESRTVHLHALLEPVVDDPSAAVAVRTALADAVRELPPRMRAAIALRYHADLSVAEVAAALGTSENTVKTQLRTALGRLREALAERPPTAALREVRHV
jgi:RNA polymerase sigma factor (sigma-70 family)